MLKLCTWLARRLPAREIKGPNGEPYLQRFYLVGFLGFKFYLHRFIASDPDRGLHDHPWLFAWALVLHGGYDEVRLVKADRLAHLEIKTFIRWKGDINRIPGDAWHRVVLPEGMEAWTLFCHWRRYKGWGFLQYETRKAAANADHHYDIVPTACEPYALNRDWDKQDWWKNPDCPKGREVLT